MKGLQTSKNICLTDAYEDTLYYKAICDCGEHSSTIILEYDEDLHDMITLAIYENIHYSEWFCDNWYEKICRRIKNAWSILFHGYQEDLGGSFIFHGEESIRDYIKALQQGIIYIKKSKNKDE